MEAFFLCLLSIVIIDLCSVTGLYDGGSHGGGSGSSTSSPSSGTSFIPVILVSVIGGPFLLFVVIFCIAKKCCGKPRMRVLPLSTQLALAQQENQYAPPSYNHVPPYGYPPLYKQPPPYSTPSAPMEVTN